MKILTKKFVITFYITTFASDNKRFLCLFVKFVLYRGPVLWEKHWTFFCIYTSRRCGGCSSSVDFSFYSVNFRLVSVKKLLKPPACFGAFRPIFWFCAKILYSIETLIDAQTAGSRPPVSMSISHHCVFFRHNYSNLQKNNLPHLKDSFRSISVFSSVMCHRHTPSSKIDLSSKSSPNLRQVIFSRYLVILKK